MMTLVERVGSAREDEMCGCRRKIASRWALIKNELEKRNRAIENVSEKAQGVRVHEGRVGKDMEKLNVDAHQNPVDAL